MSIAQFIQAMPKVELFVQLEGAVQKKTLQMIAEQNEVAESLRHFQDWLNLLDKPDYKRLHEIIKVVGGWLVEPEDLTRLAYDVGTTLARQNVKYAEVCVNTMAYSQLQISPDEFLAAINDGRDRAQRAWGIELAWVFTVPRDEPRRADEIARWIGSITARRGNALGMGLTGRENIQPVEQFERAFKSVERKSIPRVVRAGDALGLEGVEKAIQALAPNRLLDAWGLASSPELMNAVADRQIGVGVNLTRAVKQGWIDNVSEYPLRTLYDADVPVFLGSDMPALLHTTLNEQYQLAVEQCGMGVDEVITMSLNAVRASFLPDERKAEMAQAFEAQYAELRETAGV